MKPKWKARGPEVSKRPQIVSFVEATLQEGLRPSAYTSPSKEASDKRRRLWRGAVYMAVT